MKTFLLLMCIITMMESSLSQAAINLKESVDSTISIVTPDSIKIKQNTNAPNEDVREISITITPQEASDASITIVKTSRIDLQPSGMTIHSITPDTLGVFKVPFSAYLPLGTYDILVDKKGFKSVVEVIGIANKQKDSISIELHSFEYLRNQNKHWKTIKWLNAGIAVAGGIASYFIHAKIKTLENEYNNAVSPSVIADKRNSISQYQKYYTISTTLTFTFIGGFGVSWLMQNSY